jgi:hypothetical protein
MVCAEAVLAATSDITSTVIDERIGNMGWAPDAGTV